MANTTFFNCGNQTVYNMRFCNVLNQDECAKMNTAVAVTPKITAMMSMIGVSIIIFRYFQTKPKLRKTYDRIMLGMSIMNFWGSLAFFIGQWTYPSVPAGAVTSPFCNFQGWLLQINSAVFWYNAVLATNFVMRIRWGWSEEKVTRIEPLLHAVAWFYPALTSFIAAGLHMYGKAGPWCWIYISYDWARWAFFFAWLWVAMFYSAVCMCLIVATVKRSDEQTAHTRDGQNAKSKKGKRLGKKTREVAIQAILYVGTFLLTWVFGTANRIQNAVMASQEPVPSMQCNVFALTWLHSFFVPLQGFFNFIVYIYPRIKDSKRKRKTRISKKASSYGDHVSNFKMFWIEIADTIQEGFRVVFGCQDRSELSQQQSSRDMDVGGNRGSTASSKIKKQGRNGHGKKLPNGETGEKGAGAASGESENQNGDKSESNSNEENGNSKFEEAANGKGNNIDDPIQPSKEGPENEKLNGHGSGNGKEKTDGMPEDDGPPTNGSHTNVNESNEKAGELKSGTLTLQ